LPKQKNQIFRRPKSALFLILIFLSGLVALSCNSGSYEPGRRALIERRQAWLEFISGQTVGDEIYFLNDKGDVSLVTVKAIALNDRVLAALRRHFPDEPRLYQKIYEWTKQGRSAVLAGIYAKDLKDDDLVKNNRFRLTLLTHRGPSVPVAKDLVNPTFAADYFPAFNGWEKILAVSFNSDLSFNPSLLVQWPAGQRQFP
jgi:hypothetical protein